jgi:hypothetical protein
MKNPKNTEQLIHSEAAMITLLCDGGYVAKSDAPLERVSEGWLWGDHYVKVYAPAPGNSEIDTGKFIQPCDDCDGFREKLLPYAVPPSCRIEVLADMKRVAMDCRRNFGLELDFVDAIFSALFSVCPDATGPELHAVLRAAELELHVKLGRFGWNEDCVGVTPEIETWRELAKGRTHELSEARVNVDWHLKRRSSGA